MRLSDRQLKKCRAEFEKWRSNIFYFGETIPYYGNTPGHHPLKIDGYKFLPDDAQWSAWYVSWCISLEMNKTKKVKKNGVK